MRRYLDDQPQNFGQFLGRTLSGTVAPYLENRRQQGILDTQTAQESALKNRDWLADQDYRNRTFGETKRHNLAMEAPKPEKAATPYHPATIEAAIIDLDRDPNIPHDKKMQIKQELIRLHQSLQKPEKPSAEDKPLTGLSQNTLYNQDVVASRGSILREVPEGGMYPAGEVKYLNPAQLGRYNALGGSEHRRAWFADDSGSVKYPNLAGRFTGSVLGGGAARSQPTDTGRFIGSRVQTQQGGFGPDGSFNSEEEWQQAKRDLGL